MKKTTTNLIQVYYECAECGKGNINCSFCNSDLEGEKEIICDKELHYHTYCYEEDQRRRINIPSKE